MEYSLKYLKVMSDGNSPAEELERRSESVMEASIPKLGTSCLSSIDCQVAPPTPTPPGSAPVRTC